MQHKLLLDYLYTCNTIPIWLLGNAQVLYHSAHKTELRPQAELLLFFERFVQKATAAPKLYVVDAVELYAVFAYEADGEKRTAIIGPAFCENPLRSGQAGQHRSLDYLYTAESAKVKMHITPNVDVDEFVAFTCVLLHLLQGKQAAAKALKQNLRAVSLQHIVNQALTGKIFNIREELELPIHDYEMEQRYLRCVREGDIEKVKDVPKLTVLPIKNELSDDPHKQYLYEMIALVTLVTRAAIEGGLDIETAYTMSDLYIRQMDAAKSTKELRSLAQNAVQDFTGKVQEQKLHAHEKYNRHVQGCIAYIREHLHLPITLQELAAHVGINNKYLSNLFVQQTGMKLTEFIQRERVNEAKTLLAYSNYSLLEISNYLAFSSQSYFIKIFKRHSGLTPQQYKDACNPAGDT